MAIDTSDFTFQGIGFVDTVGIPGCTDSTATNYDANATINDGSCVAGTGLFTFIPDYNFRAELHLSYSVSDWYDTDNGEIVGVVAGKWCLTSDINTVTNLDISSSDISDLTGIEDFTALTELRCYYNQLDVSANTVLDTLECNDNNLTSLDVRNGNNTAFTNFISTSNPNLYCISVDDPVYSAANWTNIDAQHYFAANC